MKHWAIRFGIRLALYGGGLYGLLKLTATHFDATEWNALILFLAMLVFVEGAMAVLAGNWPQRKRGRAPWEVAAAVAVLFFMLDLARPAVDEVRADSYTSLVALVEINRW